MRYHPATEYRTPDLASPPGNSAVAAGQTGGTRPSVLAIGEEVEDRPKRNALATALGVTSCCLSLVWLFGADHLFALFSAAAEWLWAVPVGPPGYGQLPRQYVPAIYLAMMCVSVGSNALAAGGLWLSRRQEDRLTRGLVGVSLVLGVPTLLMSLFVLVDHEHSPLRWLQG